MPQNLHDTAGQVRKADIDAPCPPDTISAAPFVIWRKNFLFANTPPGAQAGAVIYSLIETAKETGLDPFCYLTWALNTAPTLDRTVDGWVGPLLPANAPEDCRVS